MATYSHALLSLTVSLLVLYINPISAASLTQQKLSHVDTVPGGYGTQKGWEFTEVLTAVSLFYICIT